MRALLVLAVLALATQVHMSEVTEFYRTFINTIPMDAQTKNRVMNNGLECINQTVSTLAASVQNIQYDVQNKDALSTLRHAIGSIQAFENIVVPKCAQTYMEIMSYLQEHRQEPVVNYSSNSYWTRPYLLDAKFKQLIAKIVIDVLNKQPNAAAKDLATIVSIGFGIMDPELPAVAEYDWDNYVPRDEKKMIPQFLKGFFNAIGIYDSAKINATSQCALDVFGSLETAFTNPAVQRGDFYTRANAFMDAFMTVTDSIERCKKLNMVDTELVQRLVQVAKQYPVESVLTVVTNNVLEGPKIRAAGLNMNTYLYQGQYELAGRLYGENIRAFFKGLIF